MNNLHPKRALYQWRTIMVIISIIVGISHTLDRIFHEKIWFSLLEWWGLTMLILVSLVGLILYKTSKSP